MLFPYERYLTLDTTLTVYHPAGEEQFARWVFQIINKAQQQVMDLLGHTMPDIEILVVASDDWQLVPHSDTDEVQAPHPYLTDVTDTPTLVVPIEVDPIFGQVTSEKFSFMLYHELALAFLEDDPRPWPQESPLWADEWQFKFLAVWLSQCLDGVQGIVNQDLRAQHEDSFEPEPDGKTPVTVRGFDWYEDTSTEDYLCYDLLVEQFAADLLAKYGPTILPRFLDHYRVEQQRLLSDDVVALLAATLGPGGEAWLEALVYF